MPTAPRCRAGALTRAPDPLPRPRHHRRRGPPPRHPQRHPAAAGTRRGTRRAGAASAAARLGRPDLVLQAGHELLEQLVGDVLDDPAAELRRLARDRQIGLHVDARGLRSLLGEGRGDRRPSGAVARLSLPFASITNLRAASSFSRKVPVPVYTSAIGPSLTLQVPLKSLPATSVTVAPGKQPATDSMSSKVCQVSPRRPGR